VATLAKVHYAAKNWKKIIGVIVTVILAIIILITLVFALFTQQRNLGSYGSGEIPPAVRQYEEPIKKELAKYGREDQINVLLAITTQESGGTASLDIMQASESLGLPPNTISDPMTSIKVGVSYFDEVMTQAENVGVDIDTAIQAYNMGNGYISFVAENGGSHSQELAQQFSNQMKERLGWNVYGDPNYVENVKRYMGEAVGIGNIGNYVGEHGLQNPYVHQEGKYVVTSEFSPARVNPKTGVLQPHNGIDLAPYGEENITIATAGDGVVTFAGMYSDGNIAVEIQHPNGLYTRYMHLAQMPIVKVGQSIKAGDIIGITGTTGVSTGVHLHFEIHEGRGNPVNPRNYLTW